MSNVSDDWLDELLEAKPTDKEVPESVWGDIHATWTGLWTDSWGEWDEKQASDLWPIRNTARKANRQPLLNHKR